MYQGSRQIVFGLMLEQLVINLKRYLLIDFA